MTAPTRARILVFDSGVGGLSVLDAIVSRNLPIVLDYAADNAWLPYGEREDAALRLRVPRLLAALHDAHGPYDLIVLACNTATTIALDETRAALSAPIVGVVPPIKPAAEITKTGVIGLLATPATVARPYTDRLIEEFASAVRVIRVGSSSLVIAAETKLRGDAPRREAVESAIAQLFNGPDGARLDAVALACTHFFLLRDELAAAAPRPIAWIDSGGAIARRVADVLALGEGHAHCASAFFTAPDAAKALEPAFRARGFTQCSSAPSPG